MNVVAVDHIMAKDSINMLRLMLASHDLPVHILSDSGPQFTSQECKSILQVNGTHWTFVSTTSLMWQWTS